MEELIESAKRKFKRLVLVAGSSRIYKKKERQPPPASMVSKAAANMGMSNTELQMPRSKSANDIMPTKDEDEDDDDETIESSTAHEW